VEKIKNASLMLDGTEMDYIRFGSGEKTLIMLPGLGDGLHTVKGTALFMALLYRGFGKSYTVYAFSRKNKMPEGCSTRDMAADVGKAMELLGIEKAHVFGVSMGGMIAQHLAADHPELVDRLVLTVTCPCTNPILNDAVSLWITQAEAGDHRALTDSNLRLIYSDKYYRANKWLTPLVGLITRPKSYERFLIMARACLSHNAVENLPRIKAETLIIGGEKDRTLGGEASRQLHSLIPHSELHIYPKGCHGLYEEEKDFNKRVLDFLK